MNSRIGGLIIWGVLAFLFATASASPLIKVGVPKEIIVYSDQEVNITWLLDGVMIDKNETLAYNHSLVFTPNPSQIGYHNLAWTIVNQNGTSTNSREIFVGTLFLVNGSTNNNTVNATTESICVEPGNRRFNLSIFVENAIMEAVPEEGDIYSDINYRASSWNILNLTDIVRNGTRSGHLPIRMANGTKYIFPFNTTNKNGTFLFGLNKPVAETANGQKINISVKAGEVKVSPRNDTTCNFVVDIADLNKIKLNLNKPASVCPRCDNNYDGLINITDYNNAKARLGIIPTV